jgi:hypothetical protein
VSAPDLVAPTGRKSAGGRDWLAAAVGSGLLLYAIVRAVALPILFDEAFTYLAFVRQPLGTLLNPLGSDREIDANNHLLNTLLVKACAALLGVSEFVFRLPNLAALASYLVFGWLILRRYSRFLPPLAGFVLITANPFLLDLFSAARGYGLSLGLLLPGLYLLARTIEGESPSREREVLAFAMLAAGSLASYSLLNVYLAALFVWGVAKAIRLSKRAGPSRRGRILPDTLRLNVPVILISGGLAAAVGPVLFALSRAGGLYWGGESGFWRDTIGSLVASGLYRAPYGAVAFPILLGMVAAGSALIAAVASLASTRRRDPPRMRVFAGIGAILGLSVAAILLEHWFLGVKFPVDRMAVSLVPLFLLSLWLALEVGMSSATSDLRRATRIGVIVLAVACLAHVVRVGRIRTSYLWQYDLDTPAMLADLSRMSERPSAPERRVRLGITPFLAAGINYYREVRNLAWLAPVDQSGPWGDYDFAYIMPIQNAEARARGYRILRRYPVTGNLLCAPPEGSATAERLVDENVPDGAATAAAAPPKRKTLDISRVSSDEFPGGVLLSHAVYREVPSGLKGLTAVFGMGTGVAPSLRSPGKLVSQRTELGTPGGPEIGRPQGRPPIQESR